MRIIISLTSDLAVSVLCLVFSSGLSQFQIWSSSFIDSLTLKTSRLPANLPSNEIIYVQAC